MFLEVENDISFVTNSLMSGERLANIQLSDKDYTKIRSWRSIKSQ